MSRKPKKGYYVKGVFVAEGSERDLELKAELKGTWDQTRTDLKKESDALQELGEALLGLRPKLLARLQLPEKLLSLVQPGDTLWIKGSRGMKLEEVLSRLYERF